MRVRLISHSDLGPLVCGYAAKVCTSAEMPECPDELAVTMRKGEELPFKKALDHALNSHHDSVLEHWSATFAIEGISRACSHQLVRHRVASYSQSSQRYVKMDGFKYVMPKTIEESNAQIWSVHAQDMRDVANAYEEGMKVISKLYQSMLNVGIPEEDARYILPNACCTNIVVTMNARELRNFFKVRVCNRAQWEIRELATEMLALCREVAPVIFDDAGANCDVLGFCPEQRSCGRCPKFTDLKARDSEGGQ